MANDSLKVSLSTLRLDNWPQWRGLAQNYFRAQGIWRLVIGEEVAPARAAGGAEDENAAAPTPFEKRKHSAMFLLLSALSPEVFRVINIADMEDPVALWRLLTQHFERKSRMSVFQILNELEADRYDGSCKPSEWIVRRQKLYDQLAAANQPIDNALQVTFTLMRLPSPGWDVVKTLMSNQQERATEDDPFTINYLLSYQF